MLCTFYYNALSQYDYNALIKYLSKSGDDRLRFYGRRPRHPRPVSIKFKPPILPKKDILRLHCRGC